MKLFLNLYYSLNPVVLLKNSTNFPVPIATQFIGFSAVTVFIPVLASRSCSIPQSRAPPPVSTIPLSAISAASSGGVFSST